MLTVLDEFIDEMAIRLDSLPKRSLVALFWACSSALLPEYRKWAASVDDHSGLILGEALAAAHQFSAYGLEPSNKEELLRLLETSSPPGGSAGKADERAETAAQDCWICADVCIRVLVQEDYNAGPAIEYALEPILHHVTEHLFGVSQVGSGPHESEQVEAVLAYPQVSRAIVFIQWAAEFLNNSSSPSEDSLELIRRRAAVLQVGQRL